MDNRKIELVLEGKEDFELAMRLACKRNKVIGYREHENCLILYHAESDNTIKLPYVMDTSEAINFVWGWLEKTETVDREPDHDGHNGKAFKIFNEDWGHVFGEWQAFIAITPEWAMYGK